MVVEQAGPQGAPVGAREGWDMKIRDAYSKPVSRAGRIRRRDETESVAETGGVAGPADQVEFSGQSFEVQRARALALQAPDIREELVDEIVAQIKQGRYHIRGTDVAPRMIREHLELRFA
jgi:flagellar biosynthesis anti-sigma factor FlgM